MAESNSFPVYPGWETVRKIGNGSFGTVYEIRRELFGTVERAALKHISIPQNQSDAEELYCSGYDDASVKVHYESYLADIVREYQLMAEMKGHTNVVYCDDIRFAEKKDGVGWDVYIKMELLTSLMKALDQVSEERQIIRLGKDMAAALTLCRSRNIIHRDIKPQNIFLSKDGDFKLGDFGIAKTVEKTAGGTKIGTYSYMAPEVYNNEPYGHEADIYSLGVVLYWLLNDCRLPFFPAPPAVPKASDIDQARLRRFRGDPLPPPAHGSKELQRIVRKACAFDPKDRYQSAEEMQRDLESLDSGSQNHAVDTQGKPSEEMEDDSTVDTAVKCTAQKEESTVSAIRGEASREEGGTGRNIEDEETVSAFRGEATPKERSTGRREEDEAAVSVFTPEEPDSSEQNPTPAPERKKTGKWMWLLGGISAVVLLLLVLLPKEQGTAQETTAEGIAQEIAAPTPTAVRTPTPTDVPSLAPRSTPSPAAASAPKEEKLTASVSPDLPTDGRLSFSSASATSEYEEESVVYSADNVIKEKSPYPWAEGVQGWGKGETLSLYFDGTKSVSALSVRLGFAQTDELFKMNNRPSRLRFSFSDGSSVECDFRDLNQEFYIHLSQAVDTWYVEVTVLAVYSGTDNDTCITTVGAYGK